MTEPAVGASTWASGSHVWKGNIGTLIAKAKKKREEEERRGVGAVVGINFRRSLVKRVQS